MSGLLLTPEEARRFGDYCRREAESHEMLAKQMETLRGMEAMIKHHRMLAAAYAIVAREIERAERVEIGPQS